MVSLTTNYLPHLYLTFNSAAFIHQFKYWIHFDKNSLYIIRLWHRGWKVHKAAALFIDDKRKQLTWFLDRDDIDERCEGQRHLRDLSRLLRPWEALWGHQKAGSLLLFVLKAQGDGGTKFYLQHLCLLSLVLQPNCDRHAQLLLSRNCYEIRIS